MQWAWLSNVIGLDLWIIRDMFLLNCNLLQSQIASECVLVCIYVISLIALEY